MSNKRKGKIMFRWLFKKEEKPKCNHKFIEIGKFYEDRRTIYRNESDVVIAYKNKKCEHCEEVKNEEVVVERFPVYFLGEGNRRDEFIQKLEKNGFQNKTDYLLRNS